MCEVVDCCGRMFLRMVSSHLAVAFITSRRRNMNAKAFAQQDDTHEVEKDAALSPTFYHTKSLELEYAKTSATASARIGSDSIDVVIAQMP